MRSRFGAASNRGAPCPMGAVVCLVRLQGTQRTEADATRGAHEHWHWGTYTQADHTQTHHHGGMSVLTQIISKHEMDRKHKAVPQKRLELPTEGKGLQKCRMWSWVLDLPKPQDLTHIMFHSRVCILYPFQVQHSSDASAE
jgi:hypothetical protein